MKDYTAIGTIVYNQRPDFKLFLGGVSKSLRASKHSIGAVYAREITKDEIHIRIQQEQPCGGGRLSSTTSTKSATPSAAQDERTR